jgi:outer membrane protein insertion porin family
MSVGGEVSVIMPIINQPFRLYYAYNPLRLYERPYCNEGLNGSRNQSCSAQLITRDLFPPGGAGDYTYAQVLQGYGAQNQFREPRKTFRLTVSTTF